MGLLSPELRKLLPPLYSQEQEEDPMVYAKFFHPHSPWTWYAIEGSPVDENGQCDTSKEKVDFLFFGYVIGFEAELGYFSLSELESVRDPLGVGLEADLTFQPMPLSAVKKRHEAASDTQLIMIIILDDESSA